MNASVMFFATLRTGDGSVREQNRPHCIALRTDQPMIGCAEYGYLAFVTET